MAGSRRARTGRRAAICPAPAPRSPGRAGCAGRRLGRRGAGGGRMTDGRVAGRVALVTGASSGIGEATAARLARRGRGGGAARAPARRARASRQRDRAIAVLPTDGLTTRRSSGARRSRAGARTGRHRRHAAGVIGPTPLAEMSATVWGGRSPPTCRGVLRRTRGRICGGATRQADTSSTSPPISPSPRCRATPTTPRRRPA